MKVELPDETGKVISIEVERLKQLLDEADDLTLHMHDKYTSIQKPPLDLKIRLSIGVQSFDLGIEPESVEHAMWHRIMLARALANLVKAEVSPEPNEAQRKSLRSGFGADLYDRD